MPFGPFLILRVTQPLTREGLNLNLFRLLTLVLCLIFVPANGQAEPKLNFSFSEVKASLSGIEISQGPDSSKLTRSPWGPNLYKETVDAVVLIIPVGAKGEIDVQGSGVVVTATGHIITNWHVVKNKKVALVAFRPTPPKRFADLQKADLWVATVIETLPEKDLAFLELYSSATGNQDISFLRFIPLEDPNFLQVGQDVFAIGHPQGLYWSYTEGVISQIRPRYKWKMGGILYQATVLQTQTAISYGSSGGPLINSKGNLVGIISNMTPGQAGFNFAISAHELVKFFINDAN